MPVLHNLRLPTLIGRLSPSHSILSSLIFTLLGIHLFITWHSARQRLRKHGEKAPAAPSWAPFGIDLLATAVRRLISNDFFTWSRELLSVPGRTVSISMIGQDLLMTDAPENIKAVLSTHFSDWAKGETFHTIWEDLMLDSIFASDGALWHANKDMLRTFISKVRSTDYDVTEKHISQLFQNLEDGESYDFFDQIDRFSLDVVTDVFFGESAGTLTSEKQPVREAVEDMYVWNTKRVLLGNLGPFLPGSPKASGVMHSYLDRVIDKARATNEESDPDEKSRREDSMLGSLLRQGLSRKLIKDAMLAIMLGGKDPSSITLVWVIYELARQPEILVKLREEIAHTVGFAPLPTPGQLKQMPLLQNIIKETLRLHPPVGYNIRVAAKDTSLPTGGGLDGTKPVGVLKGTHIITSNLGVQRLHSSPAPPSLPSFDIFAPSRWQSWTPDLWTYLPFNHGNRVCLGRNFAMMQMEYFLCRIFQEFESVQLMDEEMDRKCLYKVKGVDGREERGEMKIKMALNTKPAGAVMVKFVKTGKRQ